MFGLEERVAPTCCGIGWSVCSSSGPIRRLNRGATIMAAANALIARTSGWTMPRLDGIATEYQLWHGDRTAAEVAANLLRTGVAAPDDWPAAKRNPFEFIRLGLQRWIEGHGGEAIRSRFRLSLALTSSLDSHYGEAKEPNPTKLFLVVEPEEAAYLVLGPTVEILDRAHPRLPATFFALLIGALSRWVRVYDHRDAQDRVEVLREWWDGDPEATNVELPDVASGVPPSMRRVPLSDRRLKQVLRTARDRKVARLVEAAVALNRLSQKNPRPQIADEDAERLADCNPPLPALLAVFRAGDAVEGCFDDEAQGMMECPPEPNVILPLDATDPAAVRATFDTLGTICRVLAGASRLMDLMPGNNLQGG